MLWGAMSKRCGKKVLPAMKRGTPVLPTFWKEKSTPGGAPALMISRQSEIRSAWIRAATLHCRAEGSPGRTARTGWVEVKDNRIVNRTGEIF